MSALMFVSVPKGQSCCIAEGCLGRERWRPMIAGYVCDGTPLCSRHKKAWEEDWARALTEYGPAREPIAA